MESPSLEQIASVAIRSTSNSSLRLKKTCRNMSFESLINTQTVSERRYFKAHGTLTSFTVCLRGSDKELGGTHGIRCRLRHAETTAVYSIRKLNA